ncbi:hypothetical protein KP509_34G073000 [Ceratopteris richardii]|uniref:Uncharacterized protein n=1 Tax=Ceratopteris richardii TaxID=49495 RepID=A0A8T2QMP6_CERRI|nr:hypothetical protein KP509_34G073000 [Ceratopteris richardii]
MQVMEHQSVNDTNLMSHMMHRENEHNAEHTFSGILNGLDFVSRLNVKRPNGLEQESDSYEKRFIACQKENAKLQEELSEAYLIKSKFAEQLKIEVEKNTGLEREVRHFQNQVAAVLSERDRILLKVEHLQRKRDGLIEKVTDLEDRLEHVTSEYAEEKGLCEILYCKLEKLKEENEVFEKIIEKFWKMRNRSMNGTTDTKNIEDIALVLLQETEDLWHYGEAKYKCDPQAGENSDELVCLRARLGKLQLEYEKELANRREMESSLSHYRNNMSCLTELMCKEIYHLRLLKGSIRNEVLSFFSEEREWIMSLQGFLHLATNVEHRPMKEHAGFNSILHADSNMMELDQCDINAADKGSSQRGRTTNENKGRIVCQILLQGLQIIIKCSYKTSVDSAEIVASMADNDSVPLLIQEKDSVNDVLEVEHQLFRFTELNQDKSGQNSVSQDDTKKPLQTTFLVSKLERKESFKEESSSSCSTDYGEALAQALQEKVAALLLLSQQEERHILESNTTSAMESQIFSLKQQLIQVTNEKLDALVKLACTQEKCLKLQEKQRSFKKLTQRGHIHTDEPIEVVESSFISNDTGSALPGSRKELMQGYLKHLWSKRQAFSVPASLTHMLSLNRSNHNNNNR